MTDESHGMEPVEEPGVPVEGQAAIADGAGDFTSGEGLVAFAGIIVIAVWVIFSILATEYFIGSLLILLSVTAAVAPRLNRGTVERVHPLPLVMKMVGYAIAIVGVYTLVEDIRFEYLDEVWAVIGGLITYAAAVMAFIGARQIKS